MLSAAELTVPIGLFGGGVTIRQQVKSVKELRQDGITIQQLDFSCGSAALATLFNSYLNKPVTEREIIDYILKHGDLKKIIERRAFSMLELKQFAQSHGAEAEGYSLTLQDMLDLGRPILVPLKLKDYHHFVIFRGMQDGRVYLADPAYGRMTMSVVEFEKAWTQRVGLTIWPKGQPAPQIHALQPGKGDNTYVASDSTGTLILQPGLQFHHNPFEFR
jgi:predicted double-glycine peptidase